MKYQYMHNGQSGYGTEHCWFMVELHRDVGTCKQTWRSTPPECVGVFDEVRT